MITWTTWTTWTRSQRFICRLQFHALRSTHSSSFFPFSTGPYYYLLLAPCYCANAASHVFFDMMSVTTPWTRWAVPFHNSMCLEVFVCSYFTCLTMYLEYHHLCPFFLPVHSYHHSLFLSLFFILAIDRITYLFFWAPSDSLWLFVVVVFSFWQFGLPYLFDSPVLV